MSCSRRYRPSEVAWRAGVLALVLGSGPPLELRTQHAPAARRLAWDDVAPIRPMLEKRGLTAASFAGYVDDLHRTHAARVREGDLDHLVFYMLQSRRFTDVPPLEPALSAKRLVERLDDPAREAFLRNPQTATAQVEPPVRLRAAALLDAFAAGSRDARLHYFRELVASAFPDAASRQTALVREYLRVMRFVYEKEFVVPRSSGAPDAVAALYRERGLSTDTAIEAGYLVSIGLGVARSLDPGFRVRRALVIGPGLDLAPRMAMLEEGPPESYQPWAIVDELVALRLSTLDGLELVAADINPRVVSHLARAREAPPSLLLLTGVAQTGDVRLAADYRDYFAGLGRAISAPGSPPGPLDVLNGHLRKTVRVSPAAAQVLRPEALDIVVERLQGPAFDLIVATNILPYFDDTELALALANIAAMLAPGGVFLHNEPRPAIGDLAELLGMPFEQSRHATIATVAGAAAPLYDSVWLHRKPPFHPHQRPARSAPAEVERRGPRPARLQRVLRADRDPDEVASQPRRRARRHRRDGLRLSGG
ncbi:MAG TPA: hypothetical protein VD833_03510, partial [Vicinamibacterales bacterium]|nr:hypothetical protein [Vicinamibacterales bacterium]